MTQIYFFSHCVRECKRFIEAENEKERKKNVSTSHWRRERRGKKRNCSLYGQTSTWRLAQTRLGAMAKHRLGQKKVADPKILETTRVFSRSLTRYCSATGISFELFIFFVAHIALPGVLESFYPRARSLARRNSKQTTPQRELHRHCKKRKFPAVVLQCCTKLYLFCTSVLLQVWAQKEIQCGLCRY